MSATARDSVDVIVVGFGTAGAAAAIAAHDAGRDVLVVEKTAAGGGNAIYSGGILFDVPDPDAVAHVDMLSFGRTPRPVIDAYVGGLHELDDWLRALGAETAPHETEYPFAIGRIAHHRFTPSFDKSPGHQGRTAYKFAYWM